MSDKATPLTAGNYLDAVPHPCPKRLKPRRPSSPTQGPPVGLTMSGGGFRATFAALGVIRYMADVGLLENLRYSSSVSGGSLTNAALACCWPKLRNQGFSGPAVDTLLIAPMAKRVGNKSLKTHLLRNAWRVVGKMNRTELLARAFDKWFVGNITMDQLDQEVRWIINAANLATGTRFTFERDIVGDYVNGYVPMADAQVPLALAAATSAAVPGAFAAMSMHELDLPCRGDDTVSLMDGGAYDNTGLEAIDGNSYNNVFTIVLAAGGVFQVGKHGHLPIVSDLMQANSSLYRQSRALRTRDMVQRFRAKTRSGVLFTLASEVDAAHETSESKAFAKKYPQINQYRGEPLAFVSTSFDRLDAGLIDRLIYHGWWLTGRTMTTYHPRKYPVPTGLKAPQVRE
jgi:NTE family protein